MIIVGIVLSPHCLNLIDDSILTISGDLRQIALVIILTRAGLSLSFSDLKKVGRSAILMCFVPACIEMVGTIVFAPLLLGVSILDAAIIGSVMAAVSPAVVVPRMIKLIENGYGTDKRIPQLILAGASVDDVLAKRLSIKYNKLWLGAEIFLFVLVGIAVDLKYALAAGIAVILLVILALVFRMLGVAVSLVKTKLNKKERLFCAVAYTPKATVQAALGTMPLAMGMSCGAIVLTVAVISFLNNRI